MPYYEYGTVADEQELVGSLDTFLTSVIGTWTKIDTVTDTASDKDLVFHSPGNGQYRDIYLRFRGTGNYVYIYGYSLWIDSGTYDGELHNSLYTRVATGSNSINYWFFGDIDYVWVVVQDVVTGTYCSGHGGLIDSYYDAADDDYPLVVIGCAADYYPLTSTNRAYMYSALSSGTAVNHIAYNTHTSLLAYGDPSDRDSNIEAHTPFIMYNTIAGHKEIRGELKGALYFSGTSFNSADWTTVSGTDMMYFIRKYSVTLCEAFGPTVSG